MFSRNQARRRFLQYLAASPLFAGLPTAARAADYSSLEEMDPRIWDLDLQYDAIKSPAEALDLFDLELAARRAQPPAHWGFVASGVDSNATLKANRADFKKYGLMPRRMVGAAPGEMRVTL